MNPMKHGMMSLAALVACASLASGQADSDTPTDYRVGPKDLLEIRVFEVPELNIERRVSESGTIDLPLIGDVSVQGQSPNEIEVYLKKLLESKYVQRASVAVHIQEFRSRPITVIGAVQQPGPLAFPGRWTLLEVLAAAGGLEERHGNVVYVMRRSLNGMADQIEINLNALMVRADPVANIPIFENDLINVPAPVPITVFCLGKVGQPGAVTFQSTERITLLAAIARAGGLTDRASKNIIIKRQDPSGREVEIEVNYKRIVDGKDPDTKLEPNDVIVVKGSFF